MKRLILTAAGFFVLVLMTNGHQSYGQGYFYNPPPINYPGGYNPGYRPQIPWTVIDPSIAGRSRRGNYYRRYQDNYPRFVDTEQIKPGDKIVTIYQAPLMSGTKTLLMVKPDTELVALDVQTNSSGKWVKVTIHQKDQKITGWIHARYLTIDTSEKTVNWKEAVSRRGTYIDRYGDVLIVGGTTSGPHWKGGQVQFTVKTRPRKIGKIRIYIDTNGTRWPYKGVHSLRRGGTVDIYVNKVRIHRIVCNVRGQHGDYWSQEAGPGSIGYDTGLININPRKDINGPIHNNKIVANPGSAVDIKNISINFKGVLPQLPSKEGYGEHRPGVYSGGGLESVFSDEKR